MKKQNLKYVFTFLFLKKVKNDNYCDIHQDKKSVIF